MLTRVFKAHPVLLPLAINAAFSANYSIVVNFIKRFRGLAYTPFHDQRPGKAPIHNSTIGIALNTNSRFILSCNKMHLTCFKSHKTLIVINNDINVVSSCRNATVWWPLKRISREWSANKLPASAFSRLIIVSSTCL